MLDTGFLPAGPLPLIGPGFRVLRPLGRVGAGLIYAAEEAGKPARLREYCPPGLVRRLPGGALEPAQARFAEAWQAGMQLFLEQGHRLAALRLPGVAPVRHAVALESGGVVRAAYTVGAPVGEPLEAALERGIYLAPAEVVRIGDQLAAALADLHGHGLTHLDVAPATISFAKGQLLLSDFAVDGRPLMPLLESQEGLVRPGYSPIELYDAGLAEPLGPPADVYSASALLFRLVTGREPPPWQARWRDPGLAEIGPRGGYPPAFLEAIRRGMAIEPADRFADAAAWRAAMGSAASAPLPSAPGSASPAPTPHEPAPRSGWPIVLLLLLLLAVVAAVAFITARYLVPETNEAAPVEDGNRIGIAAAPVPERPVPAPLDDRPPLLTPGNLAAGQLTSSDLRRADGAYEDRFRLVGEAGDRFELRLSSGDFDPLLRVAGPGLAAENDDETPDGRNSRLLVTLPRPGEYQVAVSSYDAGETGSYVLQVERATAPAPQPAPAPDPSVRTIDQSVAGALAGRWHGAGDPQCAKPAVNQVEGDRLTSTIGGITHVHRILAADGGTVRTIVIGGPLAGRSFVFRLTGEGDGYTIEGETWLRC